MSHGGAHEQDTPAILGDAGWFPEDCDVAANTLSFVRADRSELARQPFLDRRWSREGMERRRLGIAPALARFEAAPVARPNLNVLWHTSFCCSTLIAKALDAPGRNLSLCEPWILVSLAGALRDETVGKGSAPPRLAELVFHLLARPPSEGEHVTVKPSNFANALVGEAARLTAGKHVFLYSTLESFLVSIAKRGNAQRHYARRLFFQAAADWGEPLRWQAEELFNMTDLEIAAQAWHLQIAQFRKHWDSVPAGCVASLDAEAFLANPADAIAALDTFLGLGLGPAHVDHVMQSPLLQRHAKLASYPYDAKRRRAEADDVRRRMGKELDEVAAWSVTAWPGTGADAPLPSPLLPISH